MATKPLKDYAKRGPFDDIDTPDSATRYLLPALRHLGEPIIWESAPPRDRTSTLVMTLRSYGFRTIEYRGEDYFGDELRTRTHYDVQVTNPPYSLKQQWVARAMELGKPWALLLPITALGVRKGSLNIHLAKCQILLPPRRIDYTGKRSPWFYSAWYTYGFHLPTESSLVPVDDDGCWDKLGLDKV